MLKLNLNIRMCLGDLPDSEHGVVVGVSWAGLSISESADLLGFPHTTCSRVDREWSEKEKVQFSGQKCLFDVRGDWPDCSELIGRQL